VQTKSEGHAGHARRSVMDNPTLCSGPDKRVPPNKVPPTDRKRTETLVVLSPDLEFKDLLLAGRSPSSLPDYRQVQPGHH
jgi:hypothetical protein